MKKNDHIFFFCKIFSPRRPRCGGGDQIRGQHSEGVRHFGVHYGGNAGLHPLLRHLSEIVVHRGGGKSEKIFFAFVILKYGGLTNQQTGQ